MKPHTQEQLFGLKSFVDSQVPPEQATSFEHKGLEVGYRVVHLPDGARPFDYAVAAAVVGEGTNAVYEIAVSDDVPEDLRDFWAWHELHDFAVVGHEIAGRCLTSEKAIIDHIAADPALLHRYVEIRTAFYEQLGRFMAADIDRNGEASTYEANDVLGAKTAIDFLRACLS